MNYRVGQMISGYEVRELLGKGGMGEVYRVRNTIADRDEALKVVLTDLSRDPELKERFQREIRVQAKLQHPNITSLHTALEHEGRLVMVMEFIDGESLAHLLYRKRLPFSMSVSYVRQALAALDYAHQGGVVHRDIKPGNMMVTRDGVIKLMDFGIAKLVTDRTLTMTGGLLGSLHYMSPEQVRSDKTIDARADIYSMGVVLYECLTGKKPFDAPSEFGIMQAQVEKIAPPPRSLDPSIPESLSQIVVRALEKDPGQRFQTAREMDAALAAVSVDPSGAPLSGPSALATAPHTPKPAPAAAVSANWPSAPPPSSPAHPVIKAPSRPPISAASQALGGSRPLQSAAAGPKTPAPLSPRKKSGAGMKAAGIAAVVLLVLGLAAVAGLAPRWMGNGSRRAASQVTKQEAAASPPASQPAAVNPDEGLTSEPAAALFATNSRDRIQKSAAAPVEAAPAPKAVAPAPARTAPTRPTPPPATSRPTRQAPAAPAPEPPAPRTQSTPPPQNPLARKSVPGETKPTIDPPPRDAPPTTASQPKAAPPATTPQPKAAPPPDRVYAQGAPGVSPPGLVHKVQASYTPEARQAGRQGIARLSVEIWPDGKAHNVAVARSSGDAGLDANAVAAMGEWVFTPAYHQGKPVKMRVFVDITFALQGSRGRPQLKNR